MVQACAKSLVIHLRGDGVADVCRDRAEIIWVLARFKQCPRRAMLKLVFAACICCECSGFFFAVGGIWRIPLESVSLSSSCSAFACLIVRVVCEHVDTRLYGILFCVVYMCHDQILLYWDLVGAPKASQTARGAVTRAFKKS